MRRRNGFSLLEMVIVIAIIALLATLAFVAFGAVRRSQEDRSTRATMETARTMFNAYVTAGQTGGNTLASDDTGKAVGVYLKLAPADWKFNEAAYPGGAPTKVDFRSLLAQPAASPPPPVGPPGPKEYALTMDYYNVPRRESEKATGIAIPMNVPLDDFTDRSKWIDAADPDYHWQLHSTMLTIRRLRSNPDAKAVWSSLRESQIVNVPVAGKTNSQQDFLIDAWGHPLLFVPGSGLRGVRFGTGPLKPSETPSYLKGDMGSTPLEQQGLRSPDGRAFWVSAGPDGYFDTHDDNLYSFDN